MGPVSRNRLWYQHVFIATALNLLQISLGSTVNFYNPSIAHFQSHRNQRNLPCVVLRTGMEGTCMFAIHCLRANGTHLGTCRDGYYFKSCCQVHDASSSSVLDHEISDNSIDQNTNSHFQHHQSSPSAETLVHKSSTTKRPSIKNTIVPLNSITVTHHSSNSHPTLSSTFSDDTLIYSTSKMPSSSTSHGDNVVLDLLTTFQNSIVTSTHSNNIESTSPVTTTKHQFLFTKSPAMTTEENTKFQTFQSVQDTVTTTTSAPTTIKSKSPSRRPTTTTTKPTKRHRPASSVIGSTTPEKETFSTTKKSVRVTTTTSKPLTTTRRPTTTTTSSYSVSSKRPTTVTLVTKPTRRVTESTVRPLINRNVTLPTNRPSATNPLKDPISSHVVNVTQHTAKPITTTTTSQPFITISYVETTKAPRPKPKPTQQIVKVSPTSLDHLVELEIPLSSTIQSVISSTTTTTSLPPVQQVEVSTSSSTMFAETKTESSTNGISQPGIPYNESSAENEIKPLIDLTTQRPILVTWSNIQTDNNDTDNVSNTETPATPTDWILLPSVLPVDASTMPTVDHSTHTSEKNISVTQHTLPTKTPTHAAPVTTSSIPSTSTQKLTTTNKPITQKPSTTNKPTTNKPTTTTNKTTTSKPATSKPTKSSTTTKTTTKTTAKTTTKTTTTETPSTAGLDSISSSTSTSTNPQVPIESNKTETIVQNTTSSTSTEDGSIPVTTGTPIVFPSDGITESSSINETAINANGTSNGTLSTTSPSSTSTMPSLKGIDYRQDGPLPSVLQEVSVPVINNTICESMYRNAGYIEHIPHIFICAGWRKGGYDSCEGDSGGPMVIQRDDKRFLLAGVISWGIGCAEPNQPGVYTIISEFRDRINQILQF